MSDLPPTPEPQPSSPPPSSPPPSGPPASSSGLAPNVASALSYLMMPITSIAFLIVEKENRSVRFHAAQGTVLGVGFLIAGVALMILTAVLGLIPLLGPLVSLVLWLAFWLSGFTLWVVLLIRAFSGHDWHVPVAANYARQLLSAPAVQ